MPASSPAGSRLTRGYAMALASAAVLSTTAIFIRHLTQTYHMPALVLAFWRDGFVCLTLLPVLALARPHLVRITGGQVVYLAAYGLLLATFNAAWTLSVALNGAALSTVLGERLTAAQFAGSLMVVTGVVFLRLHEGRLDGPTPREAGPRAEVVPPG